MAAYTPDMAAEYRRRFIGLRQANTFLKLKRQSGTGGWNCAANMFDCVRHFDITHDDDFDWLCAKFQKDSRQPLETPKS